MHALQLLNVQKSQGNVTLTRQESHVARQKFLLSDKNFNLNLEIWGFRNTFLFK